VKSGFLQEEDVKIVSKQIKDRIGQYRSRGNVVESQSKTSEVTQESQQQQQPESAQNVTQHGTSNSPAQSGEKHTQISKKILKQSRRIVAVTRIIFFINIHTFSVAIESH
jgi:hypothetical protein